MERYCSECGTKMQLRELEKEGMIPFCPSCGKFRFPLFNVCVSMIVREKKSGDILLIRQYGKKEYVLVAGYVSRGESEEETVVREVKEETGLDALSIHFNRTRFFEKTNTLVCNFTVFIEDKDKISVNEEVDEYSWFAPDQAREAMKAGNLAENSLAAEFLNLYLNEMEINYK